MILLSASKNDLGIFISISVMTYRDTCFHKDLDNSAFPSSELAFLSLFVLGFGLCVHSVLSIGIVRFACS